MKCPFQVGQFGQAVKYGYIVGRVESDGDLADEMWCVCTRIKTGKGSALCGRRRGLIRHGRARPEWRPPSTGCGTAGLRGDRAP